MFFVHSFIFVLIVYFVSYEICKFVHDALILLFFFFRILPNVITATPPKALSFFPLSFPIIFVKARESPYFTFTYFYHCLSVCDLRGIFTL